MRETVEGCGRLLPRKSFDKVTLQLLSPGPYESEFSLERDCVMITLGVSTCVMSINGNRSRKSRVSTGTIDFYPAGTTIWARSIQHVGDTICLHVHPTMRDEFEQAGSIRALEEPHRMSSADAATLAHIARRISYSDDSLDHLATESVAILALSTILRGGRFEAPFSCDTTHKRGISEVLDYIAAHFSEPLSLDDLAQVAELSRFQFSRTFHEEIGMSPYQYVLERRLSNARELLANGDDPLADVALASGFSSQSHMTDHFSRKLGVTPARFRRATRSSEH
ncbi:MAG: AraC family transcriptional regulator [Myxococcota bacterium]